MSQPPNSGANGSFDRPLVYHLSVSKPCEGPVEILLYGIKRDTESTKRTLHSAENPAAIKQRSCREERSRPSKLRVKLRSYNGKEPRELRSSASVLIVLGGGHGLGCCFLWLPEVGIGFDVFQTPRRSTTTTYRRSRVLCSLWISAMARSHAEFVAAAFRGGRASSSNRKAYPQRPPNPAPQTGPRSGPNKYF